MNRQTHPQQHKSVRIERTFAGLNREQQLAAVRKLEQFVEMIGEILDGLETDPQALQLLRSLPKPKALRRK